MDPVPCCLLNVDGINYKIDLKLKNGEKKIDLKYLKKHLAEIHEELIYLDLVNNDKCVIEVLDPVYQEYVQADDDVEILNKTRLRVRNLDIGSSAPLTNGTETVVDEVLIVKDLEDRTHLVNSVCKLHSDFISQLRSRRRKSNYILEENLKLKEKFWSAISDELAFVHNRSLKPEQCMAMFFGLLSQYQYILRKYKRSTVDKVQEIWPFFKSFHHKIDCKLFAKGFSNLISGFNTCRKDNKESKDQRHHSKSEYSRLEEDFNLITSVINRLSSFRKPPRVAAWKVISEDMADYNSPNSRMTAFRWQKRFHELLTKYLQISSRGSQLDKETWPLYSLFSQVDIELFMKPSDKTPKEKRSTESPIIELSDSDPEFVVIDEINGESDREETQMVDLEEEEIRECVQEVINDLLDQL